jgi:DNA-binding CsgD family transcriptional regulator
VPTDYRIFDRFIESYLPCGFADIAPDDPLIVEIEHAMDANRQFFYIADVIRLKMLFESRGISSFIGSERGKTDLGMFITSTTEDDLRRHHLARARLISMAQEMYVRRAGISLLSTNTRARRYHGTVVPLLYQCLQFYSTVPYDTVYLLLVFTDISEWEPLSRDFHFYIGSDRSYFRHPDADLLSVGIPFTRKEFEILQFLEAGYSTEQIAEKLYRSIHTINTHRSNIIRKSDKSTTSEVILDLKNKGLL